MSRLFSRGQFPGPAPPAFGHHRRRPAAHFREPAAHIGCATRPRHRAHFRQADDGHRPARRLALRYLHGLGRRPSQRSRHVRSWAPGTSSGKLLLARLEDWRRLLATVSAQGLTAEQQRGLFGELSILRDLILPEAGPAGVLAWTGPDRQLQDFQFPGGAIEVKTASGNNAKIVRIANERQLDCQLAGQLFLVTLALDARQEGPGLTLPDLVGDLRGKIRPLGSAAEFEQRLNMGGYLETQAHLYGDRRYTVRQRLIHAVDGKFPRITERDIPDGLSDVSYTLDLHAASGFRTSEPEMIRSLGLIP